VCAERAETEEKNARRDRHAGVRESEANRALLHGERLVRFFSGVEAKQTAHKQRMKRNSAGRRLH